MLRMVGEADGIASANHIPPIGSPSLAAQFPLAGFLKKPAKGNARGFSGYQATLSARSFATLNFTTVFAGTSIMAPVEGFLA